MKLYAKLKRESLFRPAGYQEVVRTYNGRWPSGWFETFVFADGSQEKACKCDACYVF